MKLSYKDKLTIIKMYENEVTQVSIAKQYEVGLSTIERIIRLYREHGFKYIRDKKGDTKYDPGI